MTDAHPLDPNPRVDALEFNPMSPVYQVMEVLISPKLAVEILETRAPNRHIKQPRVDQYARDMKKGHWLRNGQTIKFDRFGRLLDGQHRLWAVIEADISVDFTVAVGLEAEAMATVDTGIPRSFADVLQINGTTSARQVAAVARMTWNYEQAAWTTRNNPSHLDLAAVMSRFPDMGEYVGTLKGKVQKLGQMSALGFICYMGHRLDDNAATRFIDGLSSGGGLEEGNPILALRERLISWRTSGSAITKGITPDYAASLMIKTWNAYLAEKEIRFLRITASEPRPVFDPPIPGLRNPAPERQLRDNV